VLGFLLVAYAFVSTDYVLNNVGCLKKTSPPLNAR
jgi:hypothetical protein